MNKTMNRLFNNLIANLELSSIELFIYWFSYLKGDDQYYSN